MIAKYFKDEDENTYTADAEGVRQLIDYAVNDCDFDAYIDGEYDTVSIEGNDFDPHDIFEKLASSDYYDSFESWKNEVSEGVGSQIDNIEAREVGDVVHLTILGNGHDIVFCDENGDTEPVSENTLVSITSIDKREDGWLTVTYVDGLQTTNRLNIKEAQMAELARYHLATHGVL